MSGPIYDDLTRTLHFVDIVKKQVFHFDTATGGLDVDQFEESVSCLALRKDRKGVRRPLNAKAMSTNTPSRPFET